MHNELFLVDQLEYWPVDKFVPCERNPRKNDHVVERMAAAIIEFGFRYPILALSDGTIVDGHLRLKAAQQLGIAELPVILADDMSEVQVKAFRLMINRSATWADWDEALLAEHLHELNSLHYDLAHTGFDDHEIDDLMAPLDGSEGQSGGNAEDEAVPEPPAIPVTQVGDLWLLGRHRLLCGDSTAASDVKRLMNGERAILFATDPPYLVDYDGTNHPSGKNDTLERKAIKNKDWSESYGITWDDADQGPDLYRGFIRVAIDHAIEPNAAWYTWHASRRQAMLEAVWTEMGVLPHQQIIWTKNRGVLTRSFYLWQHEPCLFGWIKGNKPPRISDQYLGTTWAMDTPDGEDRPDHPTPKPLDCFAIPMKQHVARGGLCYEPFSGSGSQIMAGEQTGRRVYAMEISPAYCDVAVKRWQQATGERATLDGDGCSFGDVAAARTA